MSAEKTVEKTTAVEVVHIKTVESEKEKLELHGSDTSSISSNFDKESIHVDDYVSDLEWSKEEESAIVRKIDTRLFTFVLLMTFVLNMDRTNISNAISDNLPADLGFGIDGVNTGTLVHAITFTAGTLVTNPIVKKVGAHRWVPILMSSWAIITWAHALIHNFSGFIAVRFFVSLTEAGFIPACLTYLTGWYKTGEMATRLAWFWGIQSFASAFSGLISFGIFRMSGIAGLQGWKWLFIIDGIFTHIVGFIAFFYIPKDPSSTTGHLRGKSGWLSERERQIAVTRIIRDDLTKKAQYKPLTWHDVKIAILDSKLWTHLIITFAGMMPTTPIGTYFPTLIKGFGFSVTTSNLLTVPACFINLFFSILIAHNADKYGNYSLHALIGCFWSIGGFLALQFLPDATNRWGMYTAVLLTASSPSWHGMQIAWMSSNLAPVGKRAIALGAVIGAANINGVPGSQIYRESDYPRFHTGNWINIGLLIFTSFAFIFQRTRYLLTNKYREKKWNSFTDEQKKKYLENTTDEGSDRLDFRFIL